MRAQLLVLLRPLARATGNSECGYYLPQILPMVLVVQVLSFLNKPIRTLRVQAFKKRITLTSVYMKE